MGAIVGKTKKKEGAPALSNLLEKSNDDDDSEKEEQDRENQVKKLLTTQEPEGWKHEIHPKLRIRLHDPGTADIEMIEMLCENEIGEVKKIEYGKTRDICYVVFEEFIAKSVVNKKKDFLQRQYHIDIIIEDDERGPENESSEDEDDAHSEDEDDAHSHLDEEVDTRKMETIEISNVNTKLYTKTDIKQFFSDKVKSSVAIERVKKMFIVTLGQADAKRILKEHEQTPFAFGGRQLALRLVDNSVLEQYPLAQSSNAVEVKDLPDSTSEQDIRKKYRDEAITNIYFKREQRSCVITYVSNSDAEGICKTKSEAKQLINAYRPNKFFWDQSNNTVHLHGLPAGITTQALQGLLSQHVNMKIRQILFGNRLQDALVVFKGDAYAEVYILTRTTPLLGCMIKASRIQPPKDFQIIGLSQDKQLTKQGIERAFEDYNCSISEVGTSEANEGFLLKFNTYPDFDECHRAGIRVVDGIQIQLTIFYPCLGFIPLNRDLANPNLASHADIPYFDASPDVLKFVSTSDTHRKAVENHMTTVSTAIQWPGEKDEQKVMLHCVLSTDDPDFDKKFRTWEDTAKINFDKKMKEFETKRLQIDDHVSNGFYEQWRQETTGENFTWRQENRELLLAGTCKKVRQLLKRASHVHDALVDLHRKGVGFITKRKTVHRALQAVQCFTNEVAQILKRQCKGVLLKYETDEVVVTGPSQDVDECLKQLGQVVNKFHFKTFEINKAMEILLQTPDVIDILRNELKSHETDVGFCVANSELHIYAKETRDIMAAKAIIDNLIHESTIDCDPDKAYIIGTDRWNQFKKKLTQENKHCVAASDSVLEGKHTIHIVKLKKVQKDIRTTVDDFLKEIGICHAKVEMELGVALVIDEFYEKKINRLQEKLDKDCKESNIVLETVPAGYLVTGPKENLPAILKELDEMSKQVTSKEVTIEAPGMSKYLLKNWDNVQAANKRHKVITLLGKGHQLNYTRKKKSTPLIELSDKPIFKSDRKGFEILVILADITALNVDAIVNAANDKLNHAGGVAGAIVEKGGKSIQTECSQYVQIHGPLKRREVYVSSPGTLRCSKIIHTVGPRYDKNSPDNDELLFEAVWYAIEAASKHKLKSVAIPMISAGIFGFPIDKCAEQIALAVMNFIESASKSALERIIIADIDSSSLKLLKSTFEALLQTEEGTESTLTVSGSKPELTKTVVTPGRPLTASGRPRTAGRVRFEKGVTGTVIELHIGDIVTEDVDVIVNTTSDNMVLDNGAVSKHILQHAGVSIQTEVTKNKPANFVCGDIVETSGGKLKCKQIYHTALKTYSASNSNSVDIFHRTVKSCLETAHRRGHKSIAFPALGAGNLKFPPSKVTELFLRTHREFTSSFRDSQLQKIIVSLRAVDTIIIQAFCNEGLTAYAPQGSGFTARPSSAAPALTKHSWTTPEGITVRIECGDIATYSVDVIVNACSKNVKLNTGGLSSHILHKSGPSIQSEVDSKYPNGAKEGSICKTSCGKLPCQEIYHCICAQFSSSSIQPLQYLQDAILSCLTEAHRSGYKSIALPAVGTGGFGFRPEICASAAEECILNFSKQNPTSKLSIIIVLRQEDSQNIQAFTKNASRTEAAPRELPHKSDVGSLATPAEKAHSKWTKVPEVESHGIWDKPVRISDTGFAITPIKQCAFGPLTIQVAVKGVEMETIQQVNFKIEGKLMHPEIENVLVIELPDRSKGEIRKAMMTILRNAEAQKLSLNLLELESTALTVEVIATEIVECIHSIFEEVGFPSLRQLRFVTQSERDASICFRTFKTKAERIVLYLFSSEKGSFQKVENMIHEMSIEHSEEEDLTSKFGSILTGLTEAQILAIKSIENRLPVLIIISKSPPTLKVTGLKEDKFAVIEMLHEMQHEMQQKEFILKLQQEAKKNLEDQKRIKEQQEEYISNTVRWEYHDGSWKGFAKHDNAVIEHASREKQTKVKLSSGCQVDFTRNIYTTATGEHKIQKQSKDLELPLTWNDDYHHGTTTLVDVPPGSAEYQKIQSTFKTSVNMKVSIVRIVRIQNIFLWTRYVNKRKHMHELGLLEQLEINLWHGTSEDVLDFINNNGFDKSYFGANGTMYGIGVYFAIHTSYSHHYAKPNSSNERAMYYTRVLTGDFTQGSQDIKVPPPKSGAISYDSVVDQMDPNLRKMYVVFHQDQTYPEYLIIYKE